MKWSATDKKVARRAFEVAYQKECAAVLDKLKEIAAAASNPDDLWEIRDFLTDVLKEINDKYDYRYSVLIFVFARLVREGWLSVADLDGLGEDKMTSINHMLSL